MKKILIILLTILISSLYANDSFKRVLITKTTKKSSLKSIKQKLDTLNVKMYVQKIPSGYYVYSKPILGEDESQMTLKKIKTRFPYAKLVTIGQSKEENEEEAVASAQNGASKKSSKNDFFVNLGFGSANTDGSTNDANASRLDNASLSYTLEGGYVYSDNLFFTVAYSDTSSDDITITHVYGSANYNLNIAGDLDAYSGILLGYSSLELNPYPSSSASTCILYGMQIGMRYDVLDSLNIYGGFQAFMLDHTISLPDVGSKIEFSMTNNFLFGVGYRF